MAWKLKPLPEQTIVITGGSSGIGLETARRAARQGARVFLVARNEEALRDICAEIRREGGEADYAAADVGDADQVQTAADAAIARFGGFDTWVNGAGVGIYQELEDVSDEDHRRVFDTNYFGVVHGALAAVKHFKAKDGGALINIGSVVSDISVPVLGAYAASKHAVKGFTDALRMELMAEPISVTLIKPSSIDTPFADHAKNTMERAARVVPPVYRPEAAAEAVLAAASHRHREITVGIGGKAMTMAAAYLPRLSDRLFAATVRKGLQSRSQPNAGRDGALYAPGQDGETRGPHRGVVPASPYTQYQTSKAGRVVATLISIGAVALLAKRNADRIRGAAHWMQQRRHRRRRERFGPLGRLAWGHRH